MAISTTLEYHLQRLSTLTWRAHASCLRRAASAVSDLSTPCYILFFTGICLYVSFLHVIKDSFIYLFRSCSRQSSSTCRLVLTERTFRLPLLFHFQWDPGGVEGWPVRTSPSTLYHRLCSAADGCCSFIFSSVSSIDDSVFRLIFCRFLPLFLSPLFLVLLCIANASPTLIIF